LGKAEAEVENHNDQEKIFERFPNFFIGWGILSANPGISPSNVEWAMGVPTTQQVTRLLKAWSQGEDAALGRLLPIVHQELHRLARRYMFGERVGHTLQTTALVNEAYLRLVNARDVNWQNRAHFFALSAQLMRRILVDSARARRELKRGGGNPKVTLNEGLVGAQQKGEDLVALDDALKTFAQVDPRKSRVVELRFFGGLTVQETAEVLQVHPNTVLRDWRLAKMWLKREMSEGGS
jgi:RNA polymerase sigma-70 factor, ECF subfamily